MGFATAQGLSGIAGFVGAHGAGWCFSPAQGGEGMWSPLSLGSSLAAWYKADAGCYTDAACLFASASSQYLSKTSPTFAPTTKMTIRFSWKPTAVGVSQVIVGRRTAQFLVYQWSDGKITVFVGSDIDYIGGSTVLVAGSQYEVVVVYDGTLSAANRVAIYINGVAETVGGGGTIPATLPASTDPLEVGTNNAAEFANGALARLGFSSLALSGAALTAAHTSTFWADMTAARQADWFSFYNLCEASGTRVDSTGLNSLTPTNGPTVAAGPGEGLAVNNSPVKRVEDQSGNARHLLQSTITSQPLWMAAIQNGRPVLRFDGVDDALIRNNATPPWDADADGIFHFACGAQRDASAVASLLGGSMSEGWSADPCGGVSFDASRLPGASLYDGAAYRHVRGSAVSLGVFSSIVSSYDPADAFLRVVVDGSSVNGSHAMDTSQSAIFMIMGRVSNSAGPYGFADVAEGCIGRYGLNAANRTGAAGYLKSRWGTP